MNGIGGVPLQQKKERSRRTVFVTLSRERVIGMVSVGYKVGDGGKLIGADVYLASLSEMMRDNKISLEKAERFAEKLNLKGKERDIFVEALTEGEVEVDKDIVKGLFNRSQCEDKELTGTSTSEEDSVETVVAQGKEPASEKESKSIPNLGASSPESPVAAVPVDGDKVEYLGAPTLEKNDVSEVPEEE